MVAQPAAAMAAGSSSMLRGTLVNPLTEVERIRLGLRHYVVGGAGVLRNGEGSGQLAVAAYIIHQSRAMCALARCGERRPHFQSRSEMCTLPLLTPARVDQLRLIRSISG